MIGSCFELERNKIGLSSLKLRMTQPTGDAKDSLEFWWTFSQALVEFHQSGIVFKFVWERLTHDFPGFHH